MANVKLGNNFSRHCADCGDFGFERGGRRGDADRVGFVCNLLGSIPCWLGNGKTTAGIARRIARAAFVALAVR